MIEIGDKVTHAVHEVGTVINTYNNGSICAVDFKGVTKRIETANLDEGANIYTGKSQAEQLKDVLVEIQKVFEYSTERINELDSGRSSVTMEIQSNVHRLYEEKLEAILNGKTK